jgi:glutaredoxin
MSDETPQENPQENPQDFSPGHEGKEHKKRHIPTRALGFAAVAILFFAIGFGTFALLGNGSTTGLATGILTADDAGHKATDYINDYLLQAGYNAEFMEANESNGVYMVSINITGPEGSTIYDSYVTKDGDLLFVSAVDISQKPQTADTQQPASTEVPKTETPNVKMFVMAYCPYGQQAESGLGPAIEAIGLDNIDFEPHFVIYSNYNGGGPNYCFDNESLYCSMHGINEIREDTRQMVVWKYWPDKWWDYVNKVNADTSTSNIEDKWAGIADSVGLDSDEIQQKFDAEALELLAGEVALNAEYGVRGSPTVFINDMQYSGGRAPENFKAAICDAFTTPPEGCNATLSAAGSTASGSC